MQLYRFEKTPENEYRNRNVLQVNDGGKQQEQERKQDTTNGSPFGRKE